MIQPSSPNFHASPKQEIHPFTMSFPLTVDSVSAYLRIAQVLAIRFCSSQWKRRENCALPFLALIQKRSFATQRAVSWGPDRVIWEEKIRFRFCASELKI